MLFANVPLQISCIKAITTYPQMLTLDFRTLAVLMFLLYLLCFTDYLLIIKDTRMQLFDIRGRPYAFYKKGWGMF